MAVSHIPTYLPAFNPLAIVSVLLVVDLLIFLAFLIVMPWLYAAVGAILVGVVADAILILVALGVDITRRARS